MQLISMQEENAEQEESYEAETDILEVGLYEINDELVKLSLKDGIEFEQFALEGL